MAAGRWQPQSARTPAAAGRWGPRRPRRRPESPGPAPESPSLPGPGWSSPRRPRGPLTSRSASRSHRGDPTPVTPHRPRPPPPRDSQHPPPPPPPPGPGPPPRRPPAPPRPSSGRAARLKAETGQARRHLGSGGPARRRRSLRLRAHKAQAGPEAGGRADPQESQRFLTRRSHGCCPLSMPSSAAGPAGDSQRARSALRGLEAAAAGRGGLREQPQPRGKPPPPAPRQFLKRAAPGSTRWRFPPGKSSSASLPASHTGTLGGIRTPQGLLLEPQVCSHAGKCICAGTW